MSYYDTSKDPSSQGKFSYYEKVIKILGIYRELVMFMEKCEYHPLHHIRSKSLLNLLTLTKALGRYYIRNVLEPWEKFNTREFYGWVMSDVTVEDVMKILGVSQATAYDYLNTLKELYLIFKVSIPMAR